MYFVFIGFFRGKKNAEVNNKKLAKSCGKASLSLGKTCDSDAENNCGL